MKRHRTFVMIAFLVTVALVGLFNVGQTSAICPSHTDFAEDMVWWSLNGSRIVTTVKLSERNPLVGDTLGVTVVVNDSITGRGISSLLADLEVLSPSGKLLLREAHQTNEDGFAQYSWMLLTEVGQHRATVGITHGGENVSKIIDSFEVGYRVQVGYLNPEINLTQGEKMNLELNLTSTSDSPEDIILKLDGGLSLPHFSVPETLKPGRNNVVLPISINETVPVGEYNISLLIMPTTMEYTAGCCNISLIVTPGCDINIVKAPSIVSQGSTSQLVVQITSHRSTTITATLRIDSCDILVKGEAVTTILNGETKQVILTVEEISSSPYQWGEENIGVSLTRNAVLVGESSYVTVYVSPSFTSVIVGYVIPVAIPLLILAERSRKTGIRLATTGVIIGGTIFFFLGLMICQSLFMMVPLTMLIVGCYIGTAAMRYIYDLPLPKQYNWTLSLGMAERMNNHNNSDTKMRSNQVMPIPEYAATGLSKLRELYEKGKYWEMIPAGYAFALDMLDDSVITVIQTKPRGYNHFDKPNAREDNDRKLLILIEQLERQGVNSPRLIKLKKLEKLYDKYTKLSRQPSGRESSKSSGRKLARSMIVLIAEFLDQSEH